MWIKPNTFIKKNFAASNFAVTIKLYILILLINCNNMELKLLIHETCNQNTAEKCQSTDKAGSGDVFNYFSSLHLKCSMFTIEQYPKTIW